MLSHQSAQERLQPVSLLPPGNLPWKAPIGLLIKSRRRGVRWVQRLQGVYLIWGDRGLWEAISFPSQRCDLSKHERFTFDAQQTARHIQHAAPLWILHNQHFIDDRQDMTEKPKHAGHIVVVSYANCATRSDSVNVLLIMLWCFKLFLFLTSFVLMPSMSKTKFVGWRGMTQKGLRSSKKPCRRFALQCAGSSSWSLLQRLRLKSIFAFANMAGFEFRILQLYIEQYGDVVFIKNKQTLHCFDKEIRDACLKREQGLQSANRSIVLVTVFNKSTPAKREDSHFAFLELLVQVRGDGTRNIIRASFSNSQIKLWKATVVTMITRRLIRSVNRPPCVKLTLTCRWFKSFCYITCTNWGCWHASHHGFTDVYKDPELLTSSTIQF